MYNSKARKEKSEKTKTCILDAAKKLFRVHGFEKVTIDEIAQRSHVSAPLIYATFKSKKGILLALLDAAFSEEKHEELVEQIYREKSPEKRLAITARLTRELYDAEKKHMAFFQGASILDPSFKEMERQREDRRYVRQEESVRMLAGQRVFASHLTITQVRDILWAFTGRDLYRMLVIERGWSSDDYEKWLAQLLIKSLL